MTSLASPALDESKLVHFNPEERIVALEKDNRALRQRSEALERQIKELQTQQEDDRTKNKALVEQNFFLSRFILYLAKRYFSSDDNARWFAGKTGKPVDEKRSHWHWCRNGGRLKFETEFPTAMHVIRHFTRSHRTRLRACKFFKVE